tara:strand:+ start:9397 stop:9573 length:177 start_codon:yes stop_codon:yes gene_type:complete
MGFNAHDLKVAFEDGIAAERQRFAELLRNMITEGEFAEVFGVQRLDPINDGHLDIGEI